MTEPVTALIVGGGFAGLGTAIRLLHRGVDDFVILERSSRTGGTWRDNTYPGAACDVPSLLYSYSFEPNPHWSRAYSGSAEILAYIDGLVDKYNLSRHIRYESDVKRMDFDDDEGTWTADVGDRQYRGRSAVLASGPLANPSPPRIPSIERFTGKAMHSARWDHGYDITGKRVAVIGTGASAVQIVPEIVRTARSVKVFQRTPGWVLPRPDFKHPVWVKRAFDQSPSVETAARQAWFWAHEAMAVGMVWDSVATTAIELAARANLRRQVRDPWLRRQLTPQFKPGCKRMLMTNEYFPALQKSNCKLITWPIATVAANGVRTADGIEHEVDCIVFATGFDVSKTGTPFPIAGKGGRVLGDDWADGIFAYKSVNVAGYPNLFLTFAPNSGPGHNSALVYMEAQIDYIVRAIELIEKRDLHSLSVSEASQARYHDRIQRRLKSTTWNSGYRSWYLTDEGYNGTMYPGFATQFVKELSVLDEEHYELVPNLASSNVT
jgi:cation diffusion facilitator CzcD-associated flavoprotein CzcO